MGQYIIPEPLREQAFNRDGGRCIFTGAVCQDPQVPTDVFWIFPPGLVRFVRDRSQSK